MVLIAALALVSCKKSTDKATCSAAIYGYTVPAATMFGGLSTCSFGILNDTTAAFSLLGIFSGNVFTNQGTYNTVDESYYMFRFDSSITKINVSGGADVLSGPSSFYFSCLQYNSFTGKLYCLSRDGHLMQVTTTATSYDTIRVATTAHSYPSGYYYGYIAVDNTTGDMYYTTGDTTGYFIEKYQPGSPSATTVATVTGPWNVYGLCFNSADNMLYAISEDHTGTAFQFIKINPATGTVTNLAALGAQLNADYYSAAIDPCRNRYILSTLIAPPAATSVIQQLSMSGAVLQTDTTATFYQGLTVH